jgi:hypothetical protein
MASGRAIRQQPVQIDPPNWKLQKKTGPIGCDLLPVIWIKKAQVLQRRDSQ